MTEIVDLSRQLVTVECPNCGFTNDVRLQQVALEETIICDGCLEEVQLKDDSGSTKRALRDIQSLLDQF